MNAPSVNALLGGPAAKVVELEKVAAAPNKPDELIQPPEQQTEEVDTAPEQQTAEEIQQKQEAAQEKTSTDAQPEANTDAQREALEEQQMTEAAEAPANPADTAGLLPNGEAKANLTPAEPEADLTPAEPLDLDTVYHEAVRYLKEIENSTRLHIRKVIRRVNKLKNFSKTTDDINAQKTLLQNRCDRDVVKLSKLEDIRAKTIRAAERLTTERDEVTKEIYSSPM